MSKIKLSMLADRVPATPIAPAQISAADRETIHPPAFAAGIQP